MANLTDDQLRDIIQGRVQVTSCAAVDIAAELLALREDKARLDWLETCHDVASVCPDHRALGDDPDADTSKVFFVYVRRAPGRYEDHMATTLRAAIDAARTAPQDGQEVE